MSFLKQLILIPVFLYVVENKGLESWVIINTLITVLTACSFGHLFYCANLINLDFHKGLDVSNIISYSNRTNNTYVIIELLLGLVFVYPQLFSIVSSLDIGYINSHQLSYSFGIIFIGKIVYQYGFLFLARLFEPVGQTHKTYKYQVIGEFIDISSTVAGIIFFKDIFYTGIFICGCNILYTLILYTYCSRHLPFSVSYSIVPARLSELKKTAVLNISFMVERFYEMGINIFVVKFYPAGTLPLFVTMRTISNAFFRAVSTVLFPLYPEIQKQFSVDNKSYVLSFIYKYWRVLLPCLIVVITISAPLLPYFYNLWTSGKINFNLNLMLLFFMAIAFQNFGVAISEFLKRVNLSGYVLRFNLVKLFFAGVLISVFGLLNVIYGLGIAIAVAELFGLVCLIVFINMFSGQKISGRYLWFLALFSLSILLYIFLGYWYFLGSNLLLLFFVIFMLKNKKYGLG